MRSEKRRSRKPNILMYSNANWLELLARVLLTLVLWGIVGIFVLLEFFVLRRFGVAVPAFGYAFPLSIVLIMTFIIWNHYGWAIIKQEKLDSIREQFEAKLANLSEEELQEVRDGLREISIELAPGIKVDHSPNHPNSKKNIDAVISNLSDEELFALRERLWQKDIKMSELQDILYEQQDIEDTH